MTTTAATTSTTAAPTVMTKYIESSDKPENNADADGHSFVHLFVRAQQGCETKDGKTAEQDECDDLSRVVKRLSQLGSHDARGKK